MFIAFLSLSHFSHRTAELYVAAISFQCKIQGMIDPTKHFIVNKTLGGLKRTAKCKKVRLPITIDILQGILTKLSAVCFDTYEATLFSSVFVLACFGFFRIGEITAASKTDKQAHRRLSIQDIKWVGGGDVLLIHVRYSKTDQLGKGTTLKLTKQNHANLCPLRLLKRFLVLRPAFPGPLFCHRNGEPLTRYQFSAVLRRALYLLNPQLKNYTTHSFRLGAASSAAKWGWSTEQIKRSGRWSSDAYKVYVQKT